MRSAAEAGAGRSASRMLVGRDEVLSRLERLYDAAAAEQVLVTALVEGPAGIGKTRVVRELGARVQSHGGDVLLGHCVAQGETTLPYAPLVDLLSDLVGREGVAAVRQWAGPAASELGRLVPALVGAGDSSPPGSAGSSRLFQALATLLQNLSSRRPLLLAIEDVHWSDTSTREMLTLLARSQQRGAVLMLVTLRSDESPVPAGLPRYLAELVRRGDQRVRLDPLTREQQAHQISDILGVPPRRRLLDDIYARAEGNPFFAEELLVLAEQGEEGLPATVRDLLLARLDSLAPATRQVLRSASIAGRVVPQPLLEAVVDISGERLESALRPAVEAHVMEPADGSLSFRHALLQESVAAGLLPGEAIRIHRRLAEVLTERPGLAGHGQGVAGQVARHWAAAGEAGHALVSSIAAGREAKDALAFAESLSHYERAIGLLDKVDDADAVLDVSRARLLWEAAEVANLSAHPDLASDLVRRAIALVDPADAHLHGYLYARLGRCLWMAADGAGALAAYETAVTLVPADPPTRWRAAVLSGLSQILMLADRFDESEALALEAIEVASQVPDARSIEGHARCNLGVDLAFTGRFEEGVRELRTARTIAEEEFDDVDDIARAMVNLHTALLAAGRAEEAAETALEGVHVGDSLGLRRRKGVWIRCDAAQVLLMLGRFGQAEDLLDEARELEPQGVDAFRTDLVAGQLLLRQGVLDEARQVLEQGLAASERLLDPQLIAPLYGALIEAAAWQQDTQAGIRYAEEAQDRLGPRVHAFFAGPLCAAAVMCSMAHQPPRRADAARWLAKGDSALAVSQIDAPHARAAMAEARAEISGRPESWAGAAADWEALGETYHAAYSHLRAAEALLAAAGDRDDAASHLGSALATATRIGASHLVQRGEDLGRRSRLRLPSAPSEGNGYRLTARERDVLDLVAEGLTDRAIGTRLFISHRTVERHVSNLLAKLDAGRRSELVATAHREGLVSGRES